MHADVPVGMEVPQAMHAGGVNLPRTSMQDVAYVNPGVPAIHAVGTSAMHAAGHFMPVATAPPEYRDFVRPTPNTVARQRGVDPALTYGQAQLMRQQLANDAVLPVAQPIDVIEDWPEPPDHEPEVNVYHTQPLTWQAPDLNIYPPTHMAFSGRSVDPNTLSMAQLCLLINARSAAEQRAADAYVDADNARHPVPQVPSPVHVNHYGRAFVSGPGGQRFYAAQAPY